MTAPGNDVLLAMLLVAFTACTGYAGGRIHQWYRTALERDQAYRDGYDTATRSLFSLAARIIRPRRSEKAAVRGTAAVTTASASAAAGSTASGATASGATASGNTATVTSILAAASNAEPCGAGRHTVPDGLVSGPTYRMNPDRVARAKVPRRVADETAQPQAAAEPTMKLVPKPRAS